ncbi:MAG: hypothetical protein JWM34_4498 [Ilumatobacteraceae bacterium]|nr:hypothetical protein [Ilumatobacteraceae bacterium]
MSEPRSILWRLVPWLFPVALIVVGLFFVASSMTGNAHPSDVVAPPNVRKVTVANAGPWALRQVLPGTTSTVTGVIMTSSTAQSTTVYSVRAVIGRVDSPIVAAPATIGTSTGTDPAGIPDDQLRTIVTCVRWTVDVSNGRIVEHGADQLSNQVGRHDMGAGDHLRAECGAATFAG